MKTRYKASSALVAIILLLLFALNYPGQGSWQDRLLWGMNTLLQTVAGQPTPAPAATSTPLGIDALLTPAPRPDAWWQAYFTDPTCPPEAERHGGLDESIARALLQAQSGVDMAVFDIDAAPIVDALITLHDDGKRVRVVTDSDNEDQSSIRRLRRHGISVVTDKRRAFMHNKFIIIDDRSVWTGSLNLTSNGVYCNHNNIVRFDHVPQLVANYRAEMDEMYEEHAFGAKSPQNTPYENFSYREAAIQNYFTPERSAIAPIARAISSAQKRIDIMAFSYTSRILGETTLGRAQSGIPVRALFEEMGAENETSYFMGLQRDQYPNVAVKKATDKGILHHKVIIIDGHTVIFGSYNFTDNADARNDENVLIIDDDALAARFMAEFEKLWTNAPQRAFDALP